MNKTQTRKTRAADVFDAELFQAVLDLCGISYRRSYFDGGWTRMVGVDTASGELTATFDRWGRRFQGMLTQPVFTVSR